MRPVTFSNCADELSVVPDCSALGTLATESCRADTDVGDRRPVVATRQDPFHRRPAPLLADTDTISR